MIPFKDKRTTLLTISTLKLNEKLFLYFHTKSIDFIDIITYLCVIMKQFDALHWRKVYTDGHCRPGLAMAIC